MVGTQRSLYLCLTELTIRTLKLVQWSQRRVGTHHVQLRTATPRPINLSKTANRSKPTYHEFEGLYLYKHTHRRRLRVTLNLSLPGKRLSPPENGGVSVGQESIESDSSARNVTKVTRKLAFNAQMLRCSAVTDFAVFSSAAWNTYCIYTAPGLPGYRRVGTTR